MAAPQIQYCTTSDSVSIAYWALGEGTPLIYMPFLMNSHMQLEWQRPEMRAFYEALARRRKLVRYDCRGIGLSDRNVGDYSVYNVNNSCSTGSTALFMGKQLHCAARSASST